MKKVTKIWGPYSERASGHMISWNFSGMRSDNVPCAWVLRFHYATREFSCRAIKTKDGKKYAETMAQQRSLRLEDVSEDYLVGKGRITDLLIERLPAEMKAKAMAGALMLGRKGDLL